jgi:hypothetical protein
MHAVQYELKASLHAVKKEHTHALSLFCDEQHELCHFELRQAG